MFKVNSRNTQTRCEIKGNKLINKWQWRRSGVFNVNLTPRSSVSIVNIICITS